MSRTALAKLLIILGTAAVCGGLLWWWQSRVRAAVPAAESPDAGGPATSADAPTEGIVEAPASKGAKFLEPARMEGTVITEEVARVLFRGVRDGKRQMYDPVAYAVLMPNQDPVWQWPEHPDGHITARTNNLGFREDADTQVEKHGLRILVAGDSHTDGLVNNDESFANLLEARLGARPDVGPCEVLNAGVGATGPQNYLGTLKKNLYLKPDVFIAVLFTGNDFIGALAVDDFFTKRLDGLPQAIANYQKLMMDANKKYGAIVVDRFNQPLKFTRFPDDADIALDAALRAFREMAQICEQEKIPFLVVVLPTKPDAEDDDRENFLELLEAIGITEDQFHVNARLGQRLAETLRAEGVRVLDTTEGLRAATSTVPHFWRKDWHLNVAGHAVVAELMEPVLEEMLGKGK